MNAKHLIAAIAVFAAAGSVFAEQTYPYVDFSGFHGTKTRAEVVAELKSAQTNGTYVAGGQEYTPADAGFVSSKTRAQVVAELKQAQADGSYAVLQEEYEGQFPVVGGSHAGSRLAAKSEATKLD